MQRRPLATLVALATVLAVTVAPAAAGEEESAGRLGTGYVLPVGAPPLPKDVTAYGWIVADLDSGEVLGAKDPHWRLAPASTLKTLTALTVIPRLDKQAWVTARFEDVNVEGSKVGLVENGRYTVQELLTALMTVSGNDAANVLAAAVGGQQKTVELMAEEAERIGAVDTVPRNPSGLDADGQVSSPYDLALIAREGMKLKDFRWYASVRRSSIAAPGGKRFEIYNHNRLITRGFDGALGIKNGYTSKAKASFVGAAERDGTRLVVAVMRAKPQAWQEAADLLDWGFAVAGRQSPVGQLVEPTDEADGEEREPDEAVAAEPPDEAVAAGPPADAAPAAEAAADRAEASAERSAGVADPGPGLLGQVLRVVMGTVLILAAAVVALRVRAVRRRQARLRARQLSRVPVPPL